MTTEDEEELEDVRPDVEVASIAHLLVGIWLIVAPFVLAFTDSEKAATANDIAIGIAVVTMSAIRIRQPLRWTSFSWIKCVLALWLITAPWIFGYDSVSAIVNDIASAVVILFFSVWSAIATISASREVEVSQDWEVNYSGEKPEPRPESHIDGSAFET